MLEMIQSGTYIYGLAILAVIGVMTKFIAAIRYGKMEKQAAEAGLTHDTQIRLWKNKYENTYRISKGINDTGLFVERCLEQSKLWGLRLSAWDRMNRILCGVNLLLSMAVLTAEQKAGTQVSVMLGHFFTSLCISGLMIFFDFFFESAEKRQRVSVNLEEYFVNILSPRLQSGTEAITAEPEDSGAESRGTVDELRENLGLSRRVEPDRERRIESDRNLAPTDNRESRRERDIEYLKESLEKIAASREPERESRQERKLRQKREEDIRLIEDVLREYLRE